MTNIARFRLATIALILLLAWVAPGAQGPPAPAADRQGWLSFVWSDNPAQRVSIQRLFLHLDDGRAIELRGHERLIAPRGGWRALAGRRVRARMPLADSERLALPGAQQATVTALEPLEQAPGEFTEEAVTGSKPWITLPCKFADIATEPKTQAYFEGMYANVRPGLDHYWREVSYGITDVAGSLSLPWMTLPEPRSTYITTSADLNRLVADCVALADPLVDFRQFTGINLMFNSDLDGFAHGGTRFLTLDGSHRTWMVTWEPPWGYSNVAVIAHEMGHGIGLPHSSGPYGETYDSPWDVMSDTWANCGRASGSDPVYGCLPQHTIAPYKDALGWLGAGRRYTLPAGNTSTITLERLASPSTGDYLLARTPTQADGNYYTVEARRRTGYDTPLPFDGVVIHKYDPTAGGFSGYFAWVVDGDGNGNTDDAGSVWTPGETFTDAANGITISVVSATATGSIVTLSHASGVTLSSLSVTGGTTAGGTVVTLQGAGFSSPATVTFGGTSAGSVSVVNSSTITLTTPAHAAGLVDVTVTCPAGSATLTGGYLYGPPPSIALVSPAAGPLGGTTLTIGGSGFVADGLAVRVGGVAASSVQLVSPTQVTAVAPPSAVHAVAAVTVTMRTGSATMNNAFTYYPLASGFSISPDIVSIAGGATVTLQGSYFALGMTTLAVDGSAVPITGMTTTSLTFTAPAHAAGPVSLVVTTPGGSAVFGNGLYYAGAPGISSVTPRLVSARGGTTVAVTGTNFIAGKTAFEYCGAPVTPASVSATSATFTTSACAAGNRALRVSNGSQQASATLVVAAGGRGDYDGDLTPDVTIYRPTTGTWFSLRSTTGYTDYSFRGWGVEAQGDVPVAGDFDGDGTDDPAVFRPSTGSWFALDSSSGYTTWRFFGWGNGTDTLVPGDYDGDGTTDGAVFRASTGTWHVRRSSNVSSPLAIVFGAAGDRPVPADYDGDGRTDIAVYRPASGTWFVLTSSSDFVSWTFRGWGMEAQGDQPAPGDFDGDGKADLCVFRPAAGTWFYVKSSEAGAWGYFGWGATGDHPVTLDFDGDGTSDATIFRPSTGEWFVRPSAGGTPWNVIFGVAGDTPIR